VTLAAAILLLVCPLTESQMVRQCSCAEFEPCHQRIHSNIWPCFDACEPQLARLGANYNMLRACITDRHQQVVATEDCVEQSLGANVCSNGPSQWTPKRYVETLKMAALNEFRQIFANVHTKLTSSIRTVEHFGTCVRKCLDRQTGNCFERLNCGLKLPADTSIVQFGKFCAIRNGFDTLGVQNLCNCFVRAGLTTLSTVCPYIRIN